MDKKDVYVYPAVFRYDDDGISISFPDLPGCFSCAWDDREAMRMAREAMGVYLWGAEDDGEELPEPTRLDRVQTGANERAVLVETYMPTIRESVTRRSVKKTLTIPAWMDEAATAQNINFSQALQDAIMQRLKRQTAN